MKWSGCAAESRFSNASFFCCFFCHIMRWVSCLSSRAESLLHDDKWKPSVWKSGTDNHVISNISKHFDLLYKCKTWYKSLNCILSHSTSKVETLCKMSIITLRPSYNLYCRPFRTQSGNNLSVLTRKEPRLLYLVTIVITGVVGHKVFCVPTVQLCSKTHPFLSILLLAQDGSSLLLLILLRPKLSGRTKDTQWRHSENVSQRPKPRTSAIRMNARGWSTKKEINFS